MTAGMTLSRRDPLHSPPPDMRNGRGILPPAARAKLDALTQQKREGGVLARSLAEQVSGLYTRLAQEEAATERLKNPPRGKKVYKDNDPEVITSKAIEDVTRQDIARIGVRQAEHGKRQAATMKLVTALEAWLDKAQTRRIEPAAGEALKLRKGGSLPEEIKQRRNAIVEKRAEIETIAEAPIPVAEAKALARAQVDQLAASARPNVSDLIAVGNEVTWPGMPAEGATPIQIPGGRFIHQAGKIHDAVAMAALLQRDALLAEIDRAIEAGEQSDAIDTEEKRTRTAALTSEILALEREEEALVMMAIDAGLSPFRRGDASPEAVLQVRIV